MATPVAPERAARTQSLFREVNDKVQRLNGRTNGDTPYAEFLCECANADCLERIVLAIGDYETIRERPARFVVAPTSVHVVPEVERIVRKTDGYWIVEKLGVAAKVAVDEHALRGSVSGERPDRKTIG